MSAKENTKQHLSVNSTPNSTESVHRKSKAKETILSHVRKCAAYMQTRSQKIVDEERRKTRERVRKHRAKMTEEARQKRRVDDHEYRRMTNVLRSYHVESSVSCVSVA